jgi:hypothetical protein
MTKCRFGFVAVIVLVMFIAIFSIQRITTTTRWSSRLPPSKPWPPSAGAPLYDQPLPPFSESFTGNAFTALERDYKHRYPNDTLPHDKCWVTGVPVVEYGDSAYFLFGALLLARSLTEHGKSKDAKLILLIPQEQFEQIPAALKRALLSEFDITLHPPQMPIPNNRNPISNAEVPYLYKLWVFGLSSFCKRIVWLGSDTLPVNDVSRLMECFPAPCAVPDVWLMPYCSSAISVNGDVLSFEPSRLIFDKIYQIYGTTPPAELTDIVKYGGPYDQGAINVYFAGEATLLPVFYNIQPNAIIENKHDKVYLSPHQWRLIHFTNLKPWNVEGRIMYNQWSSWWQDFYKHWDDACQAAQRAHPGLESVVPCPIL